MFVCCAFCHQTMVHVMCTSTVLISCYVSVEYSTFYADFDLELHFIAIVKQTLCIWMVPNVYCFTQPCKLYKYALATPNPLATSVEATGVEGGASDVPFATLDHWVMIHPPRSLRLHTLHYLTIPLCPRLCVCMWVRAMYALALLGVSNLPFSVHYGTVCSSVRICLCVCVCACVHVCMNRK